MGFVLLARHCEALAPRFIRIAWGYFLVQGTLTAYGCLNRWPEVEGPLRLKSFGALIAVAVFPVIINILPFAKFRLWRKIAIGFGLLEVLLFIARGKGLFLASSFSGGFIALCMGLGAAWVLPLLAYGVWITKGATAFLVLLGLCSAVFRRQWKVGLALGLFALLIGYFNQGAELWNDAYRVVYWKKYMTWWWADWIPLTGTGLGTFEWFGQLIFGAQPAYVFHQMHNDFLQVFFETGIPGGILFLGVYAHMLYTARDRLKVLAPLLGIGALALTYHPLYMPITALIAVCLVRETYRGANDL